MPMHFDPLDRPDDDNYELMKFVTWDGKAIFWTEELFDEVKRKLRSGALSKITDPSGADHLVSNAKAIYPKPSYYTDPSYISGLPLSGISGVSGVCGSPYSGYGYVGAAPGPAGPPVSMLMGVAAGPWGYAGAGAPASLASGSMYGSSYPGYAWPSSMVALSGSFRDAEIEESPVNQEEVNKLNKAWGEYLLEREDRKDTETGPE